jgi:RNA polymerase sigma factor (sigma-70 family)
MSAQRPARRPGELTDEDLLASPVPEHFALFYRRHARFVLGYFARATHDPEVAADLTAETFAAALRARSRFRPGGAPASSWLFGIAAHKLADWRRRGYAEQRACRRLGMERIELTAEDITDIDGMAGEVTVLSYVSDLPPEQSDAVRERVLRERDYAAIAADQGVTEQVARKRVSRGLAALRTRLAPRS